MGAMRISKWLYVLVGWCLKPLNRTHTDVSAWPGTKHTHTEVSALPAPQAPVTY